MLPEQSSLTEKRIVYGVWILLFSACGVYCGQFILLYLVVIKTGPTMQTLETRL